MSTQGKALRYKELEVKSVSQEKLILMLYDGAVKFLNNAVDAIESKKYDVANDNLVRVQRIFTELMISLNMDVGEIAENLYTLYQYMYDKLVDGNINKNMEPVKDVIDMLINLRGIWVQAIEEKRKQTAAAKEEAATKETTGFDFVG